MLCNLENNYDVVVTSYQATVIQCENKVFNREYWKVIPFLKEQFDQKSKYTSDFLSSLKTAQNFERKECCSKIEKGNMNVFLLRDFKNQVSFADVKTKKKL